MTTTGSRSLLLRRRAVVVSLAVVGLVVSAAGYGSTRVLARSSSPAPGVGNDVSALRTLPAPVSIDAPVRTAVSATASRSGGDVSTAISSLRELLPDVGTAHSQLYAFRGAAGEVCFLLWQRMSSCPQDGRTFEKGIVWGVAGGYPTARGTVPSAVLGVVADDVRSLTLYENARRSVVPVVRNAFFRELRDVAAGSSWDVRLVVARSDGSETSIVLPDPRR